MLLCKALKGRLNEFSQKITGGDTRIPPDSCRDPEERLRLLMVKLHPKIQSGTSQPKEKDEYFSLLFKLSHVASCGDLRFLDVYNNAYETIVKNQWSSEENSKYVMPFLQIYGRVLRERLRRMHENEKHRSM